jgi:hypothetical protein
VFEAQPDGERRNDNDRKFEDHIVNGKLGPRQKQQASPVDQPGAPHGVGRKRGVIPHSVVEGGPQRVAGQPPLPRFCHLAEIAEERAAAV